MSEPWEDFAQEDGPWADFSAPPAPRQQASWSDVLQDAPAAAGRWTAEALLNFGPNVANLLTAGAGVATGTAPELPYEPVRLPDYTPENMSGPQRVAHTGIASAVSGAMAPAQGVRQAASNLALGGGSGVAGEGVTQATDSPELGMAAGIAAPIGLQAGGQRLAASGQRANELNALRDRTAREAQGLGLSLPAADVNPTLVQRGAQSIAGQGVQRSMQRRNPPVVREAVGRDLGIDAAQMTPDGIRQAVLQPAGAVMQQVADAPIIYRTSQVAGPYWQTIQEIQAPNSAMAQRFPGLESPQIDTVAAALRNGQPVTGRDALTALQIMRERASALGLRAADGEADARRVSMAYRQGADALENLMDAELRRQGYGGLVSQFRDARRQYARGMTALNAMNPATGDIDPIILRRLLDAGEPLSNNALTIARTAQAHEGSMRLPKQPSQQAASIGATAEGAVSAGLRAIPAAVVSSAPYRAMFGQAPDRRRLLAQLLGQGNPYGVAGVTAPMNAQTLADMLRQQENQ